MTARRRTTASARSAGAPRKSRAAHSSSRASRSAEGSRSSPTVYARARRGRRGVGTWLRVALHSRPRLPWTAATRQWVGGFGLLILGGAVFVAQLGSYREHLLSGLFERLHIALGWGAWLVPLILACAGLWLIARSLGKRIAIPWARVMALGVLLVLALAMTQRFTSLPATRAGLARGGGLLGERIDTILTDALGGAGAVVVLAALALAALPVMLGVSTAEFLASAASAVGAARGLLGRSVPAPIGTPGTAPRARKADAQVAVPDAARATVPVEVPQPAAMPTSTAEGRAEDAKLKAGSGRPSPSARVTNSEAAIAAAPAATAQEPVPAWQAEPGPWDLPHIENVLGSYQDGHVNVAELREKSRLIERTLGSLGVPVSVVEVNPGPAVTQFGLEPGYTERKDQRGRLVRSKVKVSRIQALSNDLALALAASPIRIEAPVPGKSVVGVEVPNSTPALVGLRGVLESAEFQATRSPLAVGLGRDVSGGAIVADLATLPHLLVAGSTGSGKSVLINAMIACLLCRNSPVVLRMLMVDPKRVELSGYDGIPHLLAPVIVDMNRVLGVLQWLLREMDQRYERLAQVGARNIVGYNERAGKAGVPSMPYIVAFIDELADLMMVSSDDVERALCRLAQMARATGIHLVVATQRPSVDVVTGLIKANFPARIAFAVSSQTDSRVILDTPGAERLLGRGDGLYMAPDSPKLVRIQGCWVSDGELRAIVRHWQTQAGTAAMHVSSIPEGELVQQALWPGTGEEAEAPNDEDALLQRAIDIVTAQGRASTSFLQRSLGIGYSRASRLMDALEQRGIVGPAVEGNRPREVLAGREPATDDVA